MSKSLSFQSISSVLLIVSIFGANGASVGVDELQAEVVLLKAEIQGLKSTMTQLELKMESNIADQYAYKTIESIQINNQLDANKFWMELLNHAKQTEGHANANRTQELLANIVTRSYNGSRRNFYPLLEFILKNHVVQAFPLLYQALEDNDHIFEGQEIFVLAKYLRLSCGDNTELFNKLPLAVRNIINGPILLKNRDNTGFIIGTQHTPCTSRTECYAQPKTEAYIYRMTQAAVVDNPRSHWHFTPPITMDMKGGFNGTRMEWGFHLKNVPQNMYLISKIRILTFFLRNDTNFDPYYAGELQCQYKPMLVRGVDNTIVMAVEDKFIHKKEFIYGSHNWGKKSDRLTLGRRSTTNKDLEGYVWEVIPATKDDNSMESASSSEENMINDLIPERKCQF